MITSDQGRAFIASYESLELKAYRDAVGVPTIGIGRIKGVKMGDVCTREQALAWFSEELNDEYEPGVRNTIRVTLSQHQFDALVSFAYNVGVGALKMSSLARLINAGDMTGAARQFAPWCNGMVGGRLTQLPGLVSRRAAEAAMFTRGEYRMHGNAFGAVPDASVQPSMLLYGSRGDAVKVMQELLTRAGYSVAADGDFGRVTHATVTRFQTDRGLVADGVCGGVTMTALLKAAEGVS